MSTGDNKLKVAIVGAGPGGLAATILLQRLPFVELIVYEQATELREVGAGISINQNTWRLLKLLGAADFLEEFRKRGDERTIDTEHRNGLTGELVGRKYQSADPETPARSRIERYRLQRALLEQIPQRTIQLRKRLVKIDETGPGIRLEFEDGSRAGPFDVVVGADGLRSAVRQHAFPSHQIAYTGKVAYRVLIPQSKVQHISGIPQGSCFWHTPLTHVYTCPLDNGLFEIATRAIENEEHGEKVSWGQVVPKEQVTKHYTGYCDKIRAIVEAPDTWLEFAMFGGPRLESVILNGQLVLIGDASHPLSGAFGSGAAFAFEDAFIVAQAIEYVWNRRQPVGDALDIFDSIRGPHYERLFGVLDLMLSNAKIPSVNFSGDEQNERIAQTVGRNWKSEETAWIYNYNIVQVWKEWLVQQNGRLGPVQVTDAVVSSAVRVPVTA